MVEARVTEGQRIAQLLAAELDGRVDGGLDRVSLLDVTDESAPASDGTLAYRVTADGEQLAAVYVHPDRARVDFTRGRAATRRAAARLATGDEKAAVSVPVESGAAVKRVVPVVQAALRGS